MVHYIIADPWVYNHLVLTPAIERPRSSMIPDSAGDEYPSYRSFINHYFSESQMTYMASTTWNG